MITNIPLWQLRSTLNELPKDKEINVICRSGDCTYYAIRILLQNGFNAKNVTGGMLSVAQNKMLDNNFTK
jgi:rhodanese-related sulfurtransferase